MRRQTISQPTELKSDAEIDLMRKSGLLVAEALRICREMAKPGVKTSDIDKAVDAHYARHGAEPLFKGYRGSQELPPFPAATCISVNEQVVHGIPGNRTIREGDLLKIDTACKLDGWCADAAVTLPMGRVRTERLRLVKVAWEVLQVAIVEIGKRRWWSEVASRMQRHAESQGFTVVQNFVGHGIGREMHESPQVPNFVSRESREQHDFQLQPGLVLAIEPMVNMGREDVEILPDQWTVVTKDGLPSVHVEHTVALSQTGVRVVTADPDGTYMGPR